MGGAEDMSLPRATAAPSRGAALLRRGLVPARHVPSFASQPPHYAAKLYRRHAT